jgi:hypothetical protein
MVSWFAAPVLSCARISFAVSLDALFPLTLALSPGERELTSAGRDWSLAVERSRARTTVPPLPGGEGWEAPPVKLGDKVFAYIHNMLIINYLGCTLGFFAVFGGIAVKMGDDT